MPVTRTAACCLGSDVGQQLLSPQKKTFVLDFSAQTSFWHLAYLDPFQPLWLSNFQVVRGRRVTASLQTKILKVRHETEELLLSCVGDAGTTALGTRVRRRGWCPNPTGLQELKKPVGAGLLKVS